MTYKASDLELEMLDPGATGFVRLFGRPNAEWDPPQPAYRVARCDPPDGKKNDYALLYLGDRIEVTAAECGVLSVDRMGNFAYDDAKAKTYRVARYTFDQPAIFIPLDVNRKLLDVDRQPYVPGYGAWQEAAHQLWSRFGRSSTACRGGRCIATRSGGCTHSGMSTRAPSAWADPPGPSTSSMKTMSGRRSSRATRPSRRSSRLETSMPLH